MRIKYLQSVAVLVAMFFMVLPYAVSADTATWYDNFDDCCYDDWRVILGV